MISASEPTRTLVASLMSIVAISTSGAWDTSIAFSTTVTDVTSGVVVTHMVPAGGALVNFTNIAWGGRGVDIGIRAPVVDSCPGGVDADGSACMATDSRKYQVDVQNPFLWGGFTDLKFRVGITFDAEICECLVRSGANGTFTELACCTTVLFQFEADNDPLGFGISNVVHDVEVVGPPTSTERATWGSIKPLYR